MTRCGCSSPGVLGCLCELVDSSCLNVSGAGSAASPYSIAPVLSGAAGQLLTCGADGLLATLNDTQPQCGREATFTLANNTETAVSLTSVSSAVTDNDTMWAAGQPTRITATTAGTYLVSAYSFYGANGAGIRRTTVRKNGTDRVAERGTPGDFTSAHPFTSVVHLAATNYLELLMLQTVGVSVQVFGRLCVVRIGNV